jgi:hypothetical protein
MHVGTGGRTFGDTKYFSDSRFKFPVRAGNSVPPRGLQRR